MERLMEFEGEMEGKDLRKIKHRMHDHPLVLRESLQGGGGGGGGGYNCGGDEVCCNGCDEPISSSSSSSSSSGAGGGGGAFYACPNSDCRFLLHKWCAELPPKIKHPSHPEHALTLPLPPLWGNTCDVCHSTIDGLHYRCSDCDFDVHVRCASMALHIQDRVDENLLDNLEGKELLIIKHSSHDHPLGLKESLQGSGGYGGGGVQVYCDGCREPISSSLSSSSSSSGAGGAGGAFYACPNSDCWFLLHKRCAELPTKIEHPSHPEHALNLSPFLLYGRECDVCHSEIDGFLYRCSSCPFGVHVRCASMAVRIQDRVDENNEIHQHALIPLEKKAQFLCDACGREHKGKSYLCPTCGFWANQICASAPTTISLRSHPHPLTLFRSSRYSIRNCKICNKRMNIAYWGYRCSEECKYLVHLGCLSLEEVENSNKDIQTNLRSESTSHQIEIPKDPKEAIISITWPMPNESDELITQLIKNLSLQGTHKRATKILRCREGHQLIFVNKKIDESNDDQLCDGCAQTISSQFYHCAQCNFSLHEWCVALPNKLQHISHPEHSLYLMTLQHWGNLFPVCRNCQLPSNGFIFGCFTCDFYLDLKCASLPRLIKHQAHDHSLALKRIKYAGFCNACGADCFAFSTCFRCEACDFRLCFKCALQPFSVRHKYDKHPFTLTYFPIKGQVDEYYCEICEVDINSKHWFYHCIECDQSLHPKCIYPIERNLNIKFGARIEVNFHSHPLTCSRRPKLGVETRCHGCGTGFTRSYYMAYECEQCNFWMHPDCLLFFH